jgi:hypothetical protein
MGTSQTNDNKNNGYVEVARDPTHPEIYKSEHVRVYIAMIPPATSTLYHRHSEDTVYIVLEGGTIRTKNFKGYKRSAIDFPRSFPFYKKIWFAIQNIFTGSVKLPQKLFFFMLNKRHDSIHKASASCRNTTDMRLMGVEIIGRNDHRRPVTLDYNLYKKEYEVDNFSVFFFKLKAGGASGIHSFTFPLFIVCVSGLAKIDVENGHTPQLEHHRLKTNDFLSTESLKTINIKNEGSETLEMIVIALQ